MAPTVTTAGSGAILPTGATEFLRRRFSEGVGLLLVAAAAFLILSLLGYSPGDPSLNSAAAGEARNPFGIPGSITADLMLQTIGLAGVLPGLILGVWGVQTLRKNPPRYVWLRICLMLICLMLLSLSMSALAIPSDWPLATRLGGVAGTVMLERSTALVAEAILALGLDWTV
ncbi:MAG: hypothetical protein HOK06_04380, partial [Rhodospirillaceae bacterium]|nr:hypothetical protein [Rhodospirillaceae bacterium]